MATITKGEIVDKTYLLMRISGLTVDATPEDKSLALSALEDMILSYENMGLFLSYNKSETYPDPDPAEESGLSDKSIQAVKLLLFENIAPAFGKVFPESLKDQRDMAYMGLFDTVPPIRIQNPRQPAGQGAYPYCNGNEQLYYSFMPREERLSVTDGGQLEDLTLDGDTINGGFDK